MEVKGRFEPYLDIVLKQMPRLLGQLDRNPMSRTYGCFDRQYWHYKTTDFPCARYQEAVLTLAMLYKIKHKKNPFFSNPKIKEWINAALDFWCRIPGHDGTLSEWYPNEHSFVATAFGAYATAETLLIMGRDVRDSGKVIRKLSVMGNWLAKREEKLAQNQECGAAAALYNIFLLTENDKYKQYALNKAKRLAETQSDEGWFNEYGGADIGYLSVALYYLAELHEKSRFVPLKKTMEKATDFLSYFVHPDMTFGGVYGSRNTEYMIPYPFELAGSGAATMIASHVRSSIMKRSSISPASLDDRYLSYIGYKYLKAYIVSRKLGAAAKPPYAKSFTKDFTGAGILVYSNPRTYLICNYRKGGAFFAFAGGKAYIDSGVAVKSGKKMISGSMSGCSHTFDGSKLVIEGRLTVLKDRPMKPSGTIALRAFQLTFGRNGAISSITKRVLRKKTITGVQKSSESFRREVMLGKKLRITDEVHGNSGAEMVTGAKSSYVYIPSSRYFQYNELDTDSVTCKSEKGFLELCRVLG